MTARRRRSFKLVVGILSAAILTCAVTVVFYMRYSAGVPGTLLRGTPQSRNTTAALYGRVLAQDGHPVPGCKVTLQVVEKLGLFNERVGLLVRVTDDDGRFSVEGESASSITVTAVTREGYYSPPEVGRVFASSDGRDRTPRTTLENPAIFHLWRRGPAEPLLRYALRATARRGEQFTLRLVDGRLTAGPAEGADLLIATRPARPATGWSVVVEVPRGGLQRTEMPIPWLAPEGGYSPRIEIAPAVGRDGGAARAQLYVHSARGGVYASVDLEVRPMLDGEFEVTVSYLVNPSGGRSLERQDDLLVNP